MATCAESIFIATWRSLPLTALNSIPDLWVLRLSEIYPALETDHSLGLLRYVDRSVSESPLINTIGVNAVTRSLLVTGSP